MLISPTAWTQYAVLSQILVQLASIDGLRKYRSRTVMASLIEMVSQLSPSLMSYHLAQCVLDSCFALVGTSATVEGVGVGDGVGITEVTSLRGRPGGL